MKNLQEKCVSGFDLIIRPAQADFYVKLSWLAQRKRRLPEFGLSIHRKLTIITGAGLITRRTVDRNHRQLNLFDFRFFFQND